MGGKSSPISMKTIGNMASSVGRLFAKGTREFASEVFYVAWCVSRNGPYEVIPPAALTDAEVAAGETHKDCLQRQPVVEDWLSGAGKKAVQLGQCAAQTPPVTAANKVAACKIGTDFLDVETHPDALWTMVQLERLVLFAVMVFSWSTMIRPVNLLSLTCQDVSFAPMMGEKLTFSQQHGRPRWVCCICALKDQRRKHKPSARVPILAIPGD